MQYNPLSATFLSIILVATPIVVAAAHADSPSFLRQGIKDPIDDWIPFDQNPEKLLITSYGDKRFYFEPATNVSECKNEGDFPFHDIAEASYLSNGTHLNTVFWLKGGFNSPIVDASEIFQPYLRTDVIFAADNDLQQFIKMERSAFQNSSVKIIETESGEDVLDGHPAYRLVFTYQGGSGELCKKCKAMQIMTKKDVRIFSILYVSPEERHQVHLPTVKNMVDSIKIATEGKTSEPDPSGIGMKMENPQDWIREEPKETLGPRFGSGYLWGNNLTGSYIYWYPNQGIYPLYNEYTMFFDVSSVYDTGVAAYVTRIAWDATSKSWTKTIEEWSSNGQNRILRQINNYSDFFREGKGYSALDFDLGIANFPEKYTTTLSTTIQFVKNGNLCTLKDRSSTVVLPPPHYEMITSPNNAVLEPGQSKDIQLSIKSETDLNSHILLWWPQTTDLVSMEFVPNKTDISASGQADIILKLNVSKNINNDFFYVAPINANISFPSTIIPEIVFEGIDISSITTNYSSSPRITEKSNFTINVHPVTIPERLNQFNTEWLTPIGGIWTFFVGIGAVIVPLFVRWYRKRNRHS